MIVELPRVIPIKRPTVTCAASPAVGSPASITMVACEPLTAVTRPIEARDLAEDIGGGDSTFMTTPADGAAPSRGARIFLTQQLVADELGDIINLARPSDFLTKRY